MCVCTCLCVRVAGVLALTEVEGECLIKLRNPNGWGGWNGAWGRDSSRWTYDLRQEHGLDGEDKGVFWMAWDDFRAYFAELTICRLLPDRVEVRAPAPPHARTAPARSPVPPACARAWA